MLHAEQISEAEESTIILDIMLHHLSEENSFNIYVDKNFNSIQQIEKTLKKCYSLCTLSTVLICIQENYYGHKNDRRCRWALEFHSFNQSRKLFYNAYILPQNDYCCLKQHWMNFTIDSWISKIDQPVLILINH